MQNKQAGADFYMNGQREALTIEQALKQEGVYVGPTVGISMLPMLKTGRDSIVVRPAEHRLKVLDVALYKRGDNYVLHRVISVTETGYIIRGDNCYSDEIVPEERILGVLCEFFRKDKHILCTDKRYLQYAKRRVRNYPFRRFLFLVRQKIKSILRRILGRKNNRNDAQNVSKTTMTEKSERTGKEEKP